jgi:hypothetical protein
MTKKWKYWVGHLILNKGGQSYPHPGANGPLIEQPVCKPDSTMPVSDRSHWGMLTIDIKQVEWYAAQHRAWGIAVYFENLHSDNDVEQGLPVFSREGEFIGFLYNPADADLAQSELVERDRRAAEWLKHCAVIRAESDVLHETIKARCNKAGCTFRFGYDGCARSESYACVELIKHYRRVRDEENIRASLSGRLSARL